MTSRRKCPICYSTSLKVEMPVAAIAREQEIRESFVAERLGYRAGYAESMDLTRFMHAGPARLLRCRTCGLFSRDEEQSASYENDLYDVDLVKELYPRFVRAFEDKISAIAARSGNTRSRKSPWRVPSGSGRVGWRPTGLDVGACTSRFARKQGSAVKRMTLEDYSPPRGRRDAIFIWNCFEQLEDPEAALSRSHRLLRPHGLLVVRVPNADFYRCERRPANCCSRALPKFVASPAGRRERSSTKSRLPANLTMAGPFSGRNISFTQISKGEP